MRGKVVTVIRWYAQDEVNQEDSEQNEVDGMKKGADSTGEVMHMWKSGWWLVTKLELVQAKPNTDIRVTLAIAVQSAARDVPAEVH